MRELQSFSEPIDALVVGANGGLGHAFVRALLGCDQVRTVHAWSRHAISDTHAKLVSARVDCNEDAQIAAAVDGIAHLNLVIVATGVLHTDTGLTPEKSWRALDADKMAAYFQTNTILPALIAKHTLPKLPRRGRAMFCALSARVGSISDNRLGGWYSYRASKAALNQIIKSLSIELARVNPDAVCLGLHPGTVDTELTAPFRKSLAPSHAVFAADDAAANLIRVLNEATPAQSGCMLAWDGSEVPA